MSEKFIGLMSGTSLDGIDAVLVEFNNTHVKLLQHYSHPLPKALRQKLMDLAHNRAGLDLDDLGETDAELGEVFAAATNELLKKSDIDARSIRAIGSHGQTIRHQPGAKFPFTLQIGDANRIAHLTGITTVADFRRHDMAAGGQGAPLVPAFHQAIFSKPGENRAVLNIGGIANVTFLSADAKTCLGFDTGPGNMLMDAWIQHHHQQHYDKNGEWSASAHPNDALLKKLMSDAFIHQRPPKSTGREHYNLEWLQKQLKDLPKMDPAEIQASLCAFTANSIAYAVQQFLPGIERIIVCGGGIHNKHLIKTLQQCMHPVTIESTEQYGLHPDWVEAAAFAWLAKQTLDHKPGNLPQVTGAKRAVILGGIYHT
jgi:anhydro-N-acetylmuramic acid kinase